MATKDTKQIKYYIDQVASDEFTCEECSRNILKIQAKITAGYFKVTLCTLCEKDYLESGKWEHLKRGYRGEVIDKPSPM